MKQIDYFRGWRPSDLLIACALGIVAVGCGGSGVSGGGTNPYAGRYSGEFTDQNDFIGACTLTVSSSGIVSGQFAYAPAVSFTGSVDNSGVGSIMDSNGTFQVTLGGAGHSTLGGGIGTVSNGAFITLDSNPTGSFSGFAGDYAGTVHNTTLGKTGIIALSIGSSGSVSGVDLFNVNGTPTLKSVSGTLNSSGLLSYVVDGVTVSGTVSLSGTTISGSLQESNGNAATISVDQVD